MPEYDLDSRREADQFERQAEIFTAEARRANDRSDDYVLMTIMFATVLSWTAGFLAVPVPAGAGIREAVLTASSGAEGVHGAPVALLLGVSGSP